MFGFCDSDSNVKRLPGNTVDRLSPGVSIIVIAILSALSWAVLVGLGISVSSLF